MDGIREDYRETEDIGVYDTESHMYLVFTLSQMPAGDALVQSGIKLTSYHVHHRTHVFVFNADAS